MKIKGELSEDFKSILFIFSSNSTGNSVLYLPNNT